ncbi:tryptophan synthase subunit alpha [Buchnera aphidicola (Neophyllaphis varicolor)]|uniref:tryptophan synthase subunit alpha n=1 Tax=Buchnera aphidicola TaxID=9 RepID=UPI0031B84749
MDRYKKLFKKLNYKKEGCFVPFLIIGDPSYETSLKIIISLIKSGADALELGIPFSDPIADGVAIQNANLRAFKSEINIHKCFKLISNIRNIYPNIPIGLLVYANIIFNAGINNFYSKCSYIGIDSVLIADVPIEEISEFYDKSIINNVSQIFICPPNAKKEFIIKLSKYCKKGYIYLISRLGVTGIDKEINKKILKNTILNLKKYCNKLPILQGFGISKISQINLSLSQGISGVICGSIFAKIIEENYNNKRNLIKKMEETTSYFKNATIFSKNKMLKN